MVGITAHHLIKEITSKESCIYCGTMLRGRRWNSEFENFLHYKTTKCPECSSDNRLKVDFQGSGHDTWDGLTLKQKIELKD